MGQAAVAILQKRLVAISVLISALAGVGFLVVFIAIRQPPHQAPVDVARSYFLADYAHDYVSAWELISDGDKAFKPRDQYLNENPLPIGVQSQLFNQLASWVEFSPISIMSSQPEQTVIFARVRYPDLTQPSVVSLLEDAEAANEDVQTLSDQVRELRDSDQLQLIEEEISFNLVDDSGTWHVVLHWDGAITVRLQAAVHPDLPWEFYPVAPEIQVMPGETVRTNYFARNNADQTITGKAVHEILPLEYRTYLETIQCFCFTEQTLEPGEEREMPLVFRVDFTVPQGIDEFSNGYTFYTLETFPEEVEQNES